MRNLSASFKARLDSSATTRCHCWKLTCRDGTIRAFTDHDRDLVIAGVTYAAASGFDATQMENTLGLAASSAQVSGALSSAALDETELSSGKYDGASIEIWLVDWADPTHRLLSDAGTLGEVSRSEFAFTAELRSLAHDLDVERGRLYQRSCSADLGDAKCRVNLALAAFHTSATALTTTDMSLTANLGAFEESFFTGGRLTFTSGANAGASVEVKEHTKIGTTALLMFWASSPHTPQPGDTFTLQAGCDKAMETCRDKFNNLVNFRGFPHMPGTDRVLTYPTSGDPALDGGSFFK